MSMFSNLGDCVRKKIATQSKSHIIIEGCIIIVLVLIMASNGCMQFCEMEKEQALRQLEADNSFEK